MPEPTRDGYDDAADLVNVALMVVSLFEQEGEPENGYVKIRAMIPAEILQRLKQVCLSHGFGDAIAEVKRIHQQYDQ